MYYIVGFFILLFIISLFHNKEYNSRNYFLAGGNNSVITVTFSLLATILGASSTIGLVGLAYKTGLAASLWLILGAIGLFILGLIYPQFNFGTQNYTITEYLQLHYGSKVKRILGLIIFLSWIGVISAQFLALARLFSFYFPEINIKFLLLFATLVVTLYTGFGGQRAVVFTDSLQFIFFLGGLSILLIKIFGKQIPDLQPEYLRFPCNKYFKISDFIYFSLVLIPVYIVGPDIHSRLFCNSSINDRRKALIITGITLIPIGLLLAFLGIFAHSQYGNINSDEILYRLSKDFLPANILFYIFVIAVVCLILSSADTCLLTSATIFIRDILGIRKKEIFFVRMAVTVVGLISFLFALYFKQIINLLLFSYSIYAVSVFIPFMVIPFKEKFNISVTRIQNSMLIAGVIAVISNILNFKWGVMLGYLLSAMIIFTPDFNSQK